MSTKKQLAAHKRWMHKKYGDMVRTYISHVVVAEGIVDSIIALHFMPLHSSSKLREQLVSELIMRLPFRNKVTVFENILKGFPSIYNENKKSIGWLRSLYERRTQFSHSFLFDTTNELNKLNKTRVGIKQYNADQCIYISLQDYKLDKEKLKITSKRLVIILAKLSGILNKKGAS